MSENDVVFGKKKMVFPLRGMNFTLWIFSKRISRQNRFQMLVKNDRVFGKRSFLLLRKMRTLRATFFKFFSMRILRQNRFQVLHKNDHLLGKTGLFNMYDINS